MSTKYGLEPWHQSALAKLYVLDGNDEVVCSLGEYKEDGTIDGAFVEASENMKVICAAPALARLLQRYVANDHVHGGCDGLTSEAEALLESLGGS